MSSHDGHSPDLSRIVNLIMQNPDLIKQIEALARQDSEGDTVPAEKIEEEKEAAAPAVAAPFSGEKQQRRARLLSALRPYVSDKRGKTLDTLIGVVDLFDAVGRG